MCANVRVGPLGGLDRDAFGCDAGLTFRFEDKVWDYMTEEPKKQASDPPQPRPAMPSPWQTAPTTPSPAPAPRPPAPTPKIPGQAPKTPNFMPDSSLVTDVIPSANYGERRDGRQP